MKKIAVRAFVLTLALAGFTATTKLNASVASANVTSFSTPGGPMPMCMPSSGQTCGID